MAKNQYTGPKQKLRRWLLAITMLCSFFCGGGLNYETSAPQPFRIKTELAFAGHPNRQTGISYKTTRAFFYKKCYPPITGEISFSQVIWQYNRLVKIKAAQFNQPYFSVYTPSRFCGVKIPQPSPAENPLRLHLG